MGCLSACVDHLSACIDMPMYVCVDYCLLVQHVFQHKPMVGGSAPVRLICNPMGHADGAIELPSGWQAQFDE